MAKLIFVNRYFHPDTSATSQLLTQLTGHLAAEGMDSLVLTSRQLYENAAASLPKRGAANGVRIERIWTTRFGRSSLFGRACDYLSFYWSAAHSVTRFARAGDTVIAMTDPPMLGLVLTPACLLRRAHLVNWLQDLFPEIAERFLSRGWARSLLRMALPARDWSLKRATANVVVGRCMQEYLQRRSIASTCITNWADTRYIRPVDRHENPLRRDWGLGDRFVVGYSGNFGRVHSFEAMLRAGELLAGRDDIVFLCIGGGQQYHWLQREAGKCGLRNWLFKPYQPAEMLRHSLSAPDLHIVCQHPAAEGLVVPSKWYGVAAAGRATAYLGGSDGEIARVVREHDCGWIIAPDDGDKLARLIADCAVSAADCAGRGATALALHARIYNAPASLAAWSGLIGKIG